MVHLKGKGGYNGVFKDGDQHGHDDFLPSLLLLPFITLFFLKFLIFCPRRDPVALDGLPPQAPRRRSEGPHPAGQKPPFVTEEGPRPEGWKAPRHSHSETEGKDLPSVILLLPGGWITCPHHNLQLEGRYGVTCLSLSLCHRVFTCVAWNAHILLPSITVLTITIPSILQVGWLCG